MPRSLVFGSGQMFVALDDRHRIRELTFPHVGLYNHLSGRAIRMGVWADGKFSWCDDDGWRIEQSLSVDDGIGITNLESHELNVQLRMRDSLSDSEYTREILIENFEERAREIRVFFTHPLTIDESDIGDTALYYPALDGVVHFKGNSFMLFAAKSETSGLFEYSTGVKDFGGMEGTWRDAEDGSLSMNPIAQGSVDSTISVRTNIEARSSSKARYRIRCARSLEELATPAFTSETRPASPGFDIADEVKRSVHILRSHLDKKVGLLAAIDSDIMQTNRANYAYVWMRDGANAVGVFDKIGDPAPARKFFEFCKNIVTPDRPFFLQKYRPDGTLGATWHPCIFEGKPETPLQEDESALVLWAIGEHLRAFPDWIGIDEIWKSLILPIANFLCDFSDSETGLPNPSYDLWEERRGIHANTIGGVIAGLRGAAKIAESLNLPLADRFSEVAESLKAALLKHFVDPDHGLIVRSLIPKSDGTVTRDQTPDASLLNLILLGVLEPGDPLSSALISRIEKELWVPGPIGGLARYSDDYYFRVSHEVPGNPWIITTLWLARAKWRLAKTEQEKSAARELLHWARQRMHPTGALPEQVHPATGEHLSVAPLAWSHAEFVLASLEIS